MGCTEEDWWFWTPRQYQRILEAKERSSDVKLTCEALRISTYHLASLKKNTSYKQFCKSFPLWFDKETRVQEIPKETVERIEKQIYGIAEQLNKQTQK